MQTVISWLAFQPHIEGGGIDPIHQFRLARMIELNLFGHDISFTQSSLFMLMSATLAIVLFGMAAARGALVPNRLQSLAEMSYEFVANMIRSTAGEEGLKFFPFIFTLFFFIVFANFIGLFPYFFTTTSHIVITGALAVVVILMVIIVGFWKNGLGFFRLFAPSGVPWYILPMLVPIEIISFLARPITLALRLFANMLAGHIMLKLLAAFTVALVAEQSAVSLIGIFPGLLSIAITALEFLVAFLQAYVFALLACVYLSDALHPAH